MADAIAGLGGGGLATPQTSNVAYVPNPREHLRGQLLTKAF